MGRAVIGEIYGGLLLRCRGGMDDPYRCASGGETFGLC